MKNKITNLDRLRMVKAAKRIAEVMPKPVVTLDRKKEQSKKACRGRIDHH
jgi:hypothetical protein